MNTYIFDYSIAKPVKSIIDNIPEEWRKVYNDRFIYVYRNNTVDSFAILATDDDNIVRFCDIKKKRKTGEYTSIYLYNGIYKYLNSMKDIKTVYNFEKTMQRKYGKTPVCVQLDRKTAERNVIRRYRNKPVYNSVSLRNNVKTWRTIPDPDGESCTDFIIIPDTWAEYWGTDSEQKIYDDIEEFIYETVGYKSCYDFSTGQMITLSWHFTRTPAGVAIIHHRGIDW